MPRKDWNSVTREAFEDLPIIIDKVSTSITYIGKAEYWTPTESEPKWRIQKWVKDGTITRNYMADGNDDYDNIWANRENLDYI